MKLTPAMKQYMDAKNEYPDSLLLFRMGDFYECFFEDAIEVSKILGITLTSRGKGETKAPLAGLPYHALDKYLKQLVQSGKKIAICEQIEDPKKAVGVVKRAVTRIISPGTVVEDSILEDKSNNYLISVFCDGSNFGLACCDISTGEFMCAEFETEKELIGELARFSPTEILISAASQNQAIISYAQDNSIFLQRINEYYYWYQKASKIVSEHFSQSIGELGLADLELAICASGSLLNHLKDTQKINLTHIKHITKFKTEDYLVLDDITIKNLELLKKISDGSKKGTLLSTIDFTKTSMGGRLLKQWVVRPLTDLQKIQQRQVGVDSLLAQSLLLEEIQGNLNQMSDIERLLSRLTYGQANARDLVNLKNSLVLLPSIKALISEIDAPILHSLSSFSKIQQVVDAIDQSLKDECPLSIREGNFIKSGFHEELDELWDIKNNASKILKQMEKEEIEKTKIPTLKIKYNRVFGYFFEVSNRYESQVPSEYTKKQSTTNAHRYITDSLKELEVKLLTSQDRIQTLEYTLFTQLVEKISLHIVALQDNAQKIAQIDCLCSFAKCSSLRQYRRPEMNSQYDFMLIDSRHPVVEVEQENFIPNDCKLMSSERMALITGPNMAGKSTYMRQVSLCIILAQMGCFIPAKQATISICDKLFSRVGSYDDVSKGHSTFMVEMSETARILHNATKRSFIILDEIGSGTSTYDGVAIAWSVAKDICSRIKAKTLFSTHYHVLTKLDQEEGVVNYNASVLEKDGNVTFLRKIIRGGTDKSYGLHVAKLAGIPDHVIENAKKIQHQLESEDTMHQKIIVEKKNIAKTKNATYVEYSKMKQRTLFDD